MARPFRFRTIAQYFFQGLIILAPIVITIWAVLSVFKYIDGILPNLLHVLLPDWIKLDEYGNPQHIPGLGFLVVISLVGYVSSSFIMGRLVALFDTVLERTPGVKIIYSTVKDFFEAFAGNKRKFDKAVLVAIESPEVWRVGFITSEDLHRFGLDNHIAVYVPQSYAFAGHVFLVTRNRVRLLPDMPSAEAMKFAITGGVTELEEHGPAHTPEAEPAKPPATTANP
jgi:uncharacterized membrane protein